MGVRVQGDTLYATAWHYVNALGGLSEEWLLALDRLSGRELWRKVFPAYTSGVSTQGAPAVFENLVFFTSAGGYEYAVDRFTRALIWQFTPTTTQAARTEPELVNDVVYHDGGDQNIYALDARTGAVRFKAFYGGMTRDDILVTARRIYVSNGGKDLLVFDRLTGVRVANVEDPSSPTVTDGLFSSPGTYASGRVFFAVVAGTVCYEER